MAGTDGKNESTQSGLMRFVNVTIHDIYNDAAIQRLTKQVLDPHFLAGLEENIRRTQPHAFFSGRASGLE